MILFIVGKRKIKLRRSLKVIVKVFPKLDGVYAHSHTPFYVYRIFLIFIILRELQLMFIKG